MATLALVLFFFGLVIAILSCILFIFISFSNEEPDNTVIHFFEALFLFAGLLLLAAAVAKYLAS